MVITFSGSRALSGPRPIDPNRDFPQLVRLLRTTFAAELEVDRQPLLDNVSSNAGLPLLWRFDPFLSRLTPGFVWEEDGQIVGNVTLLPTNSNRRYIVANVAIHTDYRRRGIARALMEVTEKEVRRRGGMEIRLQVKEHNEAAQLLYRSLGYSVLGSVTTWKQLGSRSYQPAADLVSADDNVFVQRLPRSMWRDAYSLDVEAFPADLNWPDPLPVDAYRQNWTRRISDFFKGRQLESWAVLDDGGELVGLAHIRSEWGIAHQLRIRVRSGERGFLEAALLQQLMRRIQVMPRRRVFLLHDAHDEVMNDLLPVARFRPDRSLEQMRVFLD